MWKHINTNLLSLEQSMLITIIKNKKTELSSRVGLRFIYPFVHSSFLVSLCVLLALSFSVSQFLSQLGPIRELFVLWHSLRPANK